MNATPRLEPGVTLVEQPDVGALHRLVLDRDTEGETLWVDAGGAASTYGLTERTPTRRALRGIRIARAFTAHQHHQLVRNCVAEASGRTGLVVAPNVATLYEAADAGAPEIDPLFDASLALLADLADALVVPVVVSAPRANDDRADAIASLADREIECRSTGLGYAYSTEGFETRGYWEEGWWQTTISYWAAVCGTRSWDAGTWPSTAITEPAESGTVDPIEANVASHQRALVTDGGW